MSAMTQRVKQLLSKLSIKNLKRVGFLAADAALVMAPARPQEGGVALVRVDAIGDFILWLDAGAALARHYRQTGRRVTLVANSVWAGFAAELGIFDAVLSVDRKRFDQSLVYRAHIARCLRQQAFSQAVQPTYSRDLHGDTLVRLTRACERIGSIGDASNRRSWEKRLGDQWYTRLVPADAEPRMEMLRNAEFVRGLGISGYRARMTDLHEFALAPLSPSLLAELAPEPIYALFPGASWTGRQWPVVRFAELAERLFQATGWKGVVCGGPADQPAAAALCQRCAAPLLNLVGRTSLAELAGVLTKAKLLVSNETAAAHIGPAVGTATVCLIGGGHFGRFLPYQLEQADERPLPRVLTHPMPCFGCNWRCIFGAPNGAVPCVEQIGMEPVWDAVQGVLHSCAEGTLRSGNLPLPHTAGDTQAW